MPDTDNKLQDLKKALDETLTFLNNPAVTTALGQIPDSIKKPVLDGLKQVLEVIKKALDELKKNLSAVTTVKDLLKDFDKQSCILHHRHPSGACHSGARPPLYCADVMSQASRSLSHAGAIFGLSIGWPFLNTATFPKGARRSLLSNT